MFRITGPIDEEDPEYYHITSDEKTTKLEDSEANTKTKNEKD